MGDRGVEELFQERAGAHFHVRRTPLVRGIAARHRPKRSVLVWEWSVKRAIRRVLLFPFGNNVDYASFYLEQGYEEGDEQKLPEGWYACVQFTLVLWNKHDPSIYISHSKH